MFATGVLRRFLSTPRPVYLQDGKIVVRVAAFAPPGLLRKRRNAFSIEKAICDWRRDRRVVRTRIRIFIRTRVYTRVTESRDLPGPCLVRRQEADENSIELDGPPSALRRSMKADVLAETNERVSFNGPRKSRSCPPRLANPLNPLRLFRLIAHRVTPRSCDFTAEKRIASRDSDDFPWPFAASWRVACRRLIAVPLEPGYRTGETDRSDRRRIGT